MEYTTMTRSESFPCIICGKPLERALESFEPQPSEGIMCETGGNYGSTIFDSIDGEQLAFNICDECMVRAGEQGRVMTRRKFRLILVDAGPLHRLVVGYERLDRPYVRWHNGLEHDDESIVMEVGELAHLPKHCVLNIPLDEIRAMAASTTWEDPTHDTAGSD